MKKKKIKLNSDQSVDMVVLLEVLFEETQANEGQASRRVSGEKLCEAEPEFGAAGFWACPSCVGKDSKRTWQRGVMSPQGLGEHPPAAHGQHGHAEC